MRSLLVFLGIVLLAAGLFWPWLSRLPVGRLPGDIVVDRPGFKVYVPIATMILVSLILSLIGWFVKK